MEIKFVSREMIYEAVPELHWRVCWDCGREQLHAERITPYVLCRECGSQDTRQMKKIKSIFVSEAEIKNQNVSS